MSGRPRSDVRNELFSCSLLFRSTAKVQATGINIGNEGRHFDLIRAFDASQSGYEPMGRKTQGGCSDGKRNRGKHHRLRGGSNP